jgi:hypothetical protein
MMPSAILQRSVSSSLAPVASTALAPVASNSLLIKLVGLKNNPTVISVVLQAGYLAYMGADTRDIVTEVTSATVGFTAGSALCYVAGAGSLLATMGLSTALVPYGLAACGALVGSPVTHVTREIIRRKTPQELHAEAMVLARKDLKIAIYSIRSILNKIKLEQTNHLKIVEINDNDSTILILSDNNQKKYIEIATTIIGEFIVVDHLSQTDFGIPVIEIKEHKIIITNGVDNIDMPEYKYSLDSNIIMLIDFLDKYIFKGQHANKQLY